MISHAHAVEAAKQYKDSGQHLGGAIAEDLSHTMADYLLSAPPPHEQAAPGGDGDGDDGEAVTEEWLRSIGFELTDDKRLTLLLDPLIYSPPCGPLPAWQGIRRSPCQYWPIPVSETRGDVRRLLAALGIPANTNAKE